MRPFEQRAIATIALVECARVGVEEIGEMLAGGLAWVRPRPVDGLHGFMATDELFDDHAIFHSQREVEMVAQQAVGIGIHQPADVVGVELQEAPVVVRPMEDRRVVDTAVVDVVGNAVLKGGWVGAHGDLDVRMALSLIG